MMDDTTLERGLRARPPTDPAYVSRLPVAPPAAEPRTDTHAFERASARLRAAPTPSWLLVAIAIVVLGVGTLLFVTRQPASIGPAVSPSAFVTPDASATPDPSATPAPFAGFVTREIEPGVFRIDNDGVRSLAWTPSSELGLYCCHFARGIGVGMDEAVWLLRPDAYFRLGAPTNHQFEGVVDEGMSDFVVTGMQGATRLWRIEQGTLMSTIPSRDGDAWRAELEGRYLAATSDGVVWTVGEDGQDVRLMRGGPGDWVSQPVPVEPMSNGSRVGGLWADDLSSVYLSLGPDLVRAVNGDWEWLQVPGEVIAAGVGSNGTAWAWTGDTWARHIEPTWATFGADILPPPARVGRHAVDPVVAPDGSLWYPPDHPWRGCDGLARFDGVTVDRYLGLLCVYGLAVARDGTVWALAGADYRADPRTPVRVYAIRSEARMPG